MQYKPLSNRVILKLIPETEEDRTVGSIVLSDSAIPVQKATVISVGQGETARDSGKLIPPEVSVGDTVLVRKGVPHLPINIDGDDCILLRENDVEAIC